MQEIIIRPYQDRDRCYVREISWETAFEGKPASIFFEDKDLLTDFLTLYFTDYEPQPCFIAETNGQVIGYLIAATDTNRLSKIFKTKILPKLLIKMLIRYTLFKIKNNMFLFHCGLSFLKGEFKMPDFYKKYPATLHINIKEGFRAKGLGSRLISASLNYLKGQKVAGVHLATMSGQASNFFKKEGFNLLHLGSRSYFRYILGKDIPVYIFGKELS